jgi:hypothetical protein
MHRCQLRTKAICGPHAGLQLLLICQSATGCQQHMSQMRAPVCMCWQMAAAGCRVPPGASPGSSPGPHAGGRLGGWSPAADGRTQGSGDVSSRWVKCSRLLGQQAEECCQGQRGCEHSEPDKWLFQVLLLTCPKKLRLLQDVS